MHRVARVLVAGGLVSIGLVAWSEDAKPEKVVEYRKALMSGAGKHMKAASLVAKGEIGRTQDLVGHAVALHDVAVATTELFPPGTGPDHVTTKARAEIWTETEKWKQVTIAFEAETKQLVEVAKGGDLAAFKSQLDRVGEACGACHDLFRVKD